MKSNLKQNQSNMDENPYKFFKIMFPILKISQQLRIPPEFVEHIHKHAFRNATFRDCSGHIWAVKLYENKTGVFVKDGWDRFFEAHSLGHYEFVTFTYDGETRFDVRIYGKDGIEKLQNNSYNELISSEHPSDDENQSEKESVYDAPTHVEIVTVNERRKRGRPRKNPLLNSQRPLSADKKDVPNRRSSELEQIGVTKISKKKMNEVEIIDSSDEEKAFRSKNTENEKISECRGLRCDEPESSKKPEDKKGLRTETRKVIIDLCDEEPGFRSENIDNSKGINTEYTTFCSNFPFFEICIDLNNNCMKYGVNLPSEFVKKYLPKTTTAMVLINEKGTSWEVTFSYKVKRFYGGWAQFMGDNKLKCGDRCIFELISEKEMKIYISRSEKGI